MDGSFVRGEIFLAEKCEIKMRVFRDDVPLYFVVDAVFRSIGER